MDFFYNLLAHIAWFHLKFAAYFSQKLKLFVDGRKNTFPFLTTIFSKNDNVIWVHVASLGEYEQGLPVIEQLKSEYPAYKVLISFFSPSGYEIKKDTHAGDAVCYLPIDTKRNAKRFLSVVRPKLAIFVKYEIWPNYISELSKKAIPTVLISAIFNKEQVYFKWYGGYMRNTLAKFSHIFVQNKASKQLLSSIQITNASISGDTRLDRVSEIVEQDNNLSLIQNFKGTRLCLVAGSTWLEDESLLVSFINSSKKRLKYIIAPHKIENDKLLGLVGAISKKTVLFSNSDLRTIANYDVLIIDNIGMLTKIYSYADIAYVGGAFATGLHNTLEPAVFGIPVIIGPNYKGFKEAEELVVKKGILSVSNKFGFEEVLNKLVDDIEFRRNTGRINATYIGKNKGASIRIMEYLRTLL